MSAQSNFDDRPPRPSVFSSYTAAGGSSAFGGIAADPHGDCDDIGLRFSSDAGECCELVWSSSAVYPCLFFLTLRSHSISFTVAQDVRKYKIGVGKGQAGRVGAGDGGRGKSNQAERRTESF